MAKLRKRGRIYYAWIPQLGGGTRLVSTGCTDPVAARTVQIRLEREAVDADHSAANKARTVDLLDDLIRSLVRKERSAATLAFTKGKAGHLRRLLPARAVEITHRVLEGFVDVRLGEGAAKATVKKELGVLRAALNLARRNSLFESDPVTVLPDLDVEYVPRTRALAPLELMAICGSLAPKKAAQVAWMVATGARWGESVRAQVEDARSGGSLWYLRGTKTKGAARTIAVPSPFRSVLAWALARANQEGRLFDAWPSPGNELRRLCVKLGIAHVSFNDLRRTHATWLREMGVEPQLIAVQLGHTTSAMAERVYGRLQPAALGRLLEERTGSVLLMSGEGGDNGGSEATDETAEDSATGEETGENEVGQDGLEPSANGLRGQYRGRQTSGNRASSGGGVSLMSGPEPPGAEPPGPSTLEAGLIRRGFWLTSASWFRRVA